MRYGSDLNNPHGSNLSSKYKSRFYKRLIPKMKNLLIEYSSNKVKSKVLKKEEYQD